MNLAMVAVVHIVALHVEFNLTVAHDAAGVFFTETTQRCRSIGASCTELSTLARFESCFKSLHMPLPTKFQDFYGNCIKSKSWDYTYQVVY